jgi:hypothetical protein
VAGIATLYRGIEYRSRGEARWAAMFHQLGWQHTYEPFDGDGYIPDFQVYADRTFLVEVKSISEFKGLFDVLGKVARGLENHWPGEVLVVGVSPLMVTYDDADWVSDAARHGIDIGAADQHFGPGLMGFVKYEPSEELSTFPPLLDPLHASWFKRGSSWSVYPAVNNAGDDWQECLRMHQLREIEGMWANACNDVKWHGKDVRT